MKSMKTQIKFMLKNIMKQRKKLVHELTLYHTMGIWDYLGTVHTSEYENKEYSKREKLMV